MIKIGKDDRITTAERYARATSTTDLTAHADTRCDADKLLAAGYATQGDPRKSLALKLYRMGQTGDMQGLHEAATAMDGWLKDYCSRKGRKPMPPGARQALVTSTLHWWLTPVCEFCQGRMFELIPRAEGEEHGAQAISTKACSACFGTGKRPLAKVVPAAFERHAQYLADELDRLVIQVTGDMARRLADSGVLDL